MKKEEHAGIISNSQSSRSKSKQTKKKISLGEIVQKTVEIFKKPFANDSAKSDKPKEIISDKVDQKKPTKKRKQQPTKSKRKKEMIAVDYPSTSLKKLENTKDQKTAKTTTRPARKKKKKSPTAEVEQLDNQFQDDEQLEYAEAKQRDTAAQISTEVNGFFYTNDKFITRFEDDDILNYLKARYPLFMKDPSDLQCQKKQILDMLQNAHFMDELLSYYDIDIYEFFKFLFRLEPDLFKGSFLKRIQKAMRYKKYAIKAKRCSFIERRKARLKNFKCVKKVSRPPNGSAPREENTSWSWKDK